MSVGQGKALRAHQHKMIGKMQKTGRAIDELKRRQDQRKAAHLSRSVRCDGCGINMSDPPSPLCVGCQAYREHQS